MSRKKGDGFKVRDAFGIAATVVGLVMAGLRGWVGLALALSLCAILVLASSKLQDFRERNLKRLIWPPWLLISVVASAVIGALLILTPAHRTDAAGETFPLFKAILANNYSEGRRLWFWLEKKEGQVVYLNVRMDAFLNGEGKTPFISVEEPYGTPKDNTLSLENGGTIRAHCAPDNLLESDCLAYELLVAATPPGRDDHLYYAHGQYYLVGYFAVGAASVEHMFSRYISLRPVDAEEAI